MISSSAAFISAITSAFEKSIQTNNLKFKNNNAKLEYVELSKDNVLWITVSNGDISQDLTIPLPSGDKNKVINYNSVTRAVGSWMVDGVEMSYYDFILHLLTKNCNHPTKSFAVTTYIDRLVRSFHYRAAALVFKNTQKIIDTILFDMPMVCTSMQIWAMCNRVQIVDPAFKSLTPQEALEYQTEMNKKYFPWTSLGLSDSGMCNNDLLKVDVRKTIPFGLAHHNPMRNLYQTLGMVGDENPIIMSKTEKELFNSGIHRTGWNWVTVFVDMPLNFEDQILVSNRHKDKFVMEHKKFTCFGKPVVSVGDNVFNNHPISVEPDGTIIRFDTPMDSASVESVEDGITSFNGTKRKVKVVTVLFKRVFKDGFKITNRHGNKGVIKLDDLGYVDDPVKGRVPIDVIVSCTSINKRKNFGQLLEALTNLVGNGTTVLDDNLVIHTDNVKKALAKKGYSQDGTTPIVTKWGTHKGIYGNVFWGCIKTTEDQLWDHNDVTRENNVGIRNAGNKISHIEMKALITTFGAGNAIIKEIESYRQGCDDVFSIIEVLNTLKGVEVNKPIISWENINPVDQSVGFFHTPADFSGTVVEEDKFKDGFYLTLPDGFKYIVYQVNGEVKENLISYYDDVPSGAVVLDKIFVPPYNMRKPWKHTSGLYGLTTTASLVNMIVSGIYKYKANIGDIGQVARAIYTYFHTLSDSLGSKTGLISTYCMSIRYPWTAKATAAVADNLDKNEIEIHSDMAKDLKVKTGDMVLVERFPCLGFMSIRTQKVRVTDDPQAKYVIRVSGNSLASLTLDFDGDVIYLMSFHNPDSKLALAKEFKNPHPLRREAYEAASNKHIPTFKSMALDDYKIEIFPSLTADKNAEIVNGLTGIKRGTGTIIALCYNIMRIMEKEIGYSNQENMICIELLLDKVANSVFSRKHAGRSLENECREAICCADVNKMVSLGMNEKASVLLADTISKKARELGVNHNLLTNAFEKVKVGKGSSIVNRIVRAGHKHWFTSRSVLHPIEVLDNLCAEPADLTGYMFDRAKKQTLNLR